MGPYYYKLLSAVFGCFIIVAIFCLSHAQNSPKDYLNAHNAARHEVAVSNLTWDNTLAAYAQNYADQRFNDCNLVHSGGPYGENLAAGSGSFSGVDAVNSWISEKAYYDYNSNSCRGGDCRHYTQVVWRKSLRLGCARVHCRNNGSWFAICNYDPPGFATTTATATATANATATATATANANATANATATATATAPVIPSPALVPTAPALITSKHTRNWSRIFLGTVAALLILLSLLGFFWCRHRKGYLQVMKRISGFRRLKHNADHEGSHVFSYTTLEIATNYFSEESLLGRGGYGPVYKGKLINGQEIAVKRLQNISGHGVEQFKNEVNVILNLQHRNLVKLMGYCAENDERILVYEYLPNKSLDSILFDTEQAILGWTSRLQIIEGIAQGLLYLHKYSRLKIIHRDLKTSNILLDKDLNPKISDFGTAKIFGDDESCANTNRIVGTYGYMAPEYAMNGIFSMKSDAFSFGVMMLEIISGRKNTSFYNSDRHINLLAYVWDLWNEERFLEIKDPKLVETISIGEVVRYVKVGLLCVEENAEDRPNMSDVVSMLQKESLSLPSPKQPAFAAILSVKNTELSKHLQPASVNMVTISDVSGR